MVKYCTAIFGILGVVIFIAATILGGYFFPGYSHLEQFISESYAIGTSHEWVLRWYGFIPSGLFLMLFGFLAPLNFPKSSVLNIGFYGIAIFYGIGTTVTGVFPCDFGCDTEMISPSLSQFIHNVAGTFAYLVTPICLLLISLKLKPFISNKTVSKWLLILSIVAILCTTLFVTNINMVYIGLVQRGLEAAILIWIVTLCLNLKKTENESIRRNKI